MHTPRQARELWCPMVRIAHREAYHEIIGKAGQAPGYQTHIDTIVAGCNTDALGGNRVPASCQCVADDCAMWRWEPTTASVPTTTEGASGLQARTFEQKTVRTHGYCGLAPLHAN